MPRRIPTAVLIQPVECGDYHAGIDEIWNRYKIWSVEHPEEHRNWPQKFEDIAKLYQTFPTAIATAKPAEPDGYTQFGFVEYPVAYPIKIAKVAK